MAAAGQGQLTAVGYMRVSTPGQEAGYSLDEQEKQIRECCALNGWELGEIHRDVLSGHKLTRAGYQAMVKAVEAGGAERIVLARHDRLGRDGIERLTRGRHFDRLGVAVVSATEGVDEPGLTRYVKAGLAEEESLNISRRTKQTRAAAAQAGTHCGPTPYGYRRRYPDQAGPRGRRLAAMMERDGERADTVQRIFERYGRGPAMTMRLLARWANTEPGIAPAADGGTWTRKTLRYLLTNPVYVGEVAYNRHHRRRNILIPSVDPAFVAPGNHEPLISRELWDAVQARITAAQLPAVRRGRDGSLPLAAGLLVCARCGGRMTRGSYRPSDSRKPSYICSNYQAGAADCGGGYIRVDVAHAALLDQVKRLRWREWDHLAVVDALPAGEQAREIAAMKTRITILKTQVEHNRLLVDVLTPDDFDTRELARTLGQLLEDELRRAQQGLAQAGDAGGVGIDQLMTLHGCVQLLPEKLRRAEEAGDEDALRASVLPLVCSARIVDRIPEKRSTWARAEVEWSESVTLLFNAGVLSLAPDAAAPPYDAEKAQRQRERLRAYRASKRQDRGI